MLAEFELGVQPKHIKRMLVSQTLVASDRYDGLSQEMAGLLLQEQDENFYVGQRLCGGKLERCLHCRELAFQWQLAVALVYMVAGVRCWASDSKFQVEPDETEFQRNLGGHKHRDASEVIREKRGIKPSKNCRIQRYGLSPTNARMLYNNRYIQAHNSLAQIVRASQAIVNCKR